MNFTKEQLNLILAALEAVNVPGKVTELHAATKENVRLAIAAANNPAFVDPAEPAAPPAV